VSSFLTAREHSAHACGVPFSVCFTAPTSWILLWSHSSLVRWWHSAVRLLHYT